MKNYFLSKHCQPHPNKSPEWYTRFHTYLSSRPSRSFTAAIRAWKDSNGSPTSTAGKQAAKCRWQERAMAFDRANQRQNSPGTTPKIFFNPAT